MACRYTHSNQFRCFPLGFSRKIVSELGIGDFFGLGLGFIYA